MSVVFDSQAYGAGAVFDAQQYTYSSDADGLLLATDQPDLASFSGSASAAGVSGSLAVSDQPDAAVFTGGVSIPVVTGMLSVTEAQDSAGFYAAGASMLDVCMLIRARRRRHR